MSCQAPHIAPKPTSECSQCSRALGLIFGPPRAANLGAFRLGAPPHSKEEGKVRGSPACMGRLLACLTLLMLHHSIVLALHLSFMHEARRIEFLLPKYPDSHSTVSVDPLLVWEVGTLPFFLPCTPLTLSLKRNMFAIFLSCPCMLIWWHWIYVLTPGPLLQTWAGSPTSKAKSRLSHVHPVIPRKGDLPSVLVLATPSMDPWLTLDRHLLHIYRHQLAPVP